MLHSLLLKKINDKRNDLPNNDYIVSFYESLMQDNKLSKMSKKLPVFYTYSVTKRALVLLTMQFLSTEIKFTLTAHLKHV